MFAETTKNTLRLLFFVGSVLVGIAIYLQWSSMDLSRNSLLKNLASGAEIRAWWSIVPAPLGLGLLFCLAGFVAWLKRSSAMHVLLLLVALFLVSLGSALLTPFGIYATFSLVCLLVMQLVVVRKHNKSLKDDAANRGAL